MIKLRNQVDLYNQTNKERISKLEGKIKNAYESIDIFCEFITNDDLKHKIKTINPNDRDGVENIANALFATTGLPEKRSIWLIIRYLRIINLATAKIRKIKTYTLSYPEFKNLVTAVNNELSAHILRGNDLNIGESLIFIARFTKHKKKVDWHESYKVLQYIASKYDQDLLDDYICKVISKKEFTTRLAPYIYSNDNPKGEKWLVYFNDEHLYYWVWKNKTFNFCAESMFYHFAPTSYIHSPNRLKEEVYKDVKSIPDILYNKRIGNLQKLTFITNFDPEYVTNYAKL